MRTLLRVLLVILLVVGLAAFFVGYRWGDRGAATQPGETTGTGGQVVDTDAARETGAQIGERVATGANQAQRMATDAGLTAKIKAKMALDDTIEAARIDVDTANGVVTLSGSVRSETERQRALQLARETAGVTSVNDRLSVSQ